MLHPDAPIDLRKYVLAVRESPSGRILGTSFCISAGSPAYLLTCHHVIRGLSSIYVWYEPEDCSFEAYHLPEFSMISRDIAVLRVDKPLPARLGLLNVYDLSVRDLDIEGYGFRKESRGHRFRGTAIDSVPCPSNLSEVTEDCQLLQLATSDTFPGMSGSPLVQLGTSKLIGMLAYGFETQTNMGEFLSYGHGIVNFSPILERLGVLPEDSTLVDSARMRWLRLHGFDQDPFEFTDSTKDIHFEHYFYQVPHFEAIAGSPDRPEVAMVFGGSGMGKSSLRTAVGSLLKRKRGLPVIYEDLYPLVDSVRSGHTVRYADHVVELMKLTLQELSRAVEYDVALRDNISHGPTELRQRLWDNLSMYLTDERDRIATLVSTVRQEDIRESAQTDIPSPDRQALRDFCSIVCELGQLKAIYFLVDPQDDISEDGDEAWQVLTPLIAERAALTLHEHKATFKFFLGDVFRDRALEIPWIAKEKLEIVHFPLSDWNRTSLKGILRERLQYFSRGTKESMGELTLDTSDLDDLLISRSSGNPRTLIQLCDRLFAVHCQHDSLAELIAGADVDRLFKEMMQLQPALIVDGKRLDTESHSVEFKSTLRYNLHTGDNDVKMEREVAKAICAFMNADGGTLVVGMGDDGQVVGIEHDLSKLRVPTREAFERAVNDVFDVYLNLKTRQGLKAGFHPSRGKLLYVIEVEPSTEPIYLISRSDNKTYYYVRSGPSSMLLHARETVEHVRTRYRRFFLQSAD